MDRRQFLALSGLGISGLAGCSSPQENQQASKNDSESGSTTETTTFADREVRVEFSGLQTGVVQFIEDFYDVVSDPNSQYLFLDVTVTSGSTPTLSEFTFHFDDEEYSPVTDLTVPVHRGEESDREYPDKPGRTVVRSEFTGGGLLLFQLPETGDASDAVLTWPIGEWKPDGELRRRIAEPLPLLYTTRWQAYIPVSRDNPPVFRFTVENKGNLPGQYFAGIWGEGSVHGPITLVSRRIEPDETEVWKVPGGPEFIYRESEMNESENEEFTMEYMLEGPYGSRSKSVPVQYE
ncbi:hypothetical protein [Halanaeroarchaeum sulfurireducens]|uniref:hypothetical protein n=1 Tax=Halanaeroarchaeum sulfurireducens TaxID=1604004 RepID=UPI0011DD0D45|nr:hypothetical protein [Halanaeroarchaeum sulfurireducens]